MKSGLDFGFAGALDRLRSSVFDHASSHISDKDFVLVLVLVVVLDFSTLFDYEDEDDDEEDVVAA